MATIIQGVVFINGGGAFAREVASTGFGRANQPMTIALSMDVNDATVFRNVATAVKAHPGLAKWQVLQAVEERSVKLQCWRDDNA